MKIARLIGVLVLVVMCFIFIASPVFAIIDPTTIWFGTKAPIKYVKAFENVNETGDMLFLAEGFVDYAAPPTDYTASEAFIFQVISADGTTVITSRPLEEYGERPISIYLTPTQVTTLGLVSATAYVMRITGNPLIFAPMVEETDMITYTLAADDWIDQSLATEDLNPLRDSCVYIATNMEEEDAATDYLETIGGVEYLTPTGANLFLLGVPSLNVFVPSLFQVTTETMTAEAPAATGNYTGSLSPLIRWGPNVPGGATSRFANIGAWFGVSEVMAAGFILLAFMVLLSVWLYKKTQSGLVVLGIGIAATLPVGTFLGMSTLVIMFILTIFVVLLLGYYFLTRGSL